METQQGPPPSIDQYVNQLNGPQPNDAEVDNLFQVIYYEMNFKDKSLFQRPAALKWMLIQESYKTYIEAPKPKDLIATITSSQSVENLYRNLHNNLMSWMNNFVREDGVNILFKEVNRLSQSLRRSPATDDVKSNIDNFHMLLKCIYELMNAKPGIDVIRRMNKNDVVNYLVFSCFPGEHQINALIFQQLMGLVLYLDAADEVLAAMEAFSIAQCLTNRFTIVADTANSDDITCSKC